MTPPYVITIVVKTGDPDGVRIVEKSGWVGRGVVFSRSDLRDAAPSLASPGVYLLIGDDPDEHFESQVYIGESENVSRRLAYQQRQDPHEFWVDTVGFVSKDDSLDKANIKFLESRLIELARSAGRARVPNDKSPPVPPMSAADLVAAEAFLGEMLAIFPVIGVDAFEKPAQEPTEQVQYFLKGPDADGKGEDRSDGFFVFEGAIARVEETPSMSPGFRTLRAKLLGTGLLVEDAGVYRLTEGHLFKSPSAAATALLARNANGREEWKDAAGVTLKQHQTAELPEVAK